MGEWGTTERIEAEVLLGDGTHLVGALFVQGRVQQHDGPETLVEMLNRPEPFTPLGLAAGGVAFLPKAQVALIATEAQPATGDGGGRPSLAAKLVGLEVEMLGGRVLSGLVSVDLPPGHSRALDFLNEAGAFFSITTNAATWIVHRAHMRGARPLD